MDAWDTRRLYQNDSEENALFFYVYILYSNLYYDITHKPYCVYSNTQADGRGLSR